MGKLLKYEFRSTYRFYAGMYILAFLASLLYFMIWGHKSNSGAGMISVISLISTVVYIITIVTTIKSYSKELYDNTGYLTFTLPRSGYEILGTKLISSVVWLCATSLAIGLIALMYVFIYSRGMGILGNVNIGPIINKSIPYAVTTALLYIVNTLFLMGMIYFSITVSKITIRNKKGGKILGFVIFIILSIVLVLITLWLLKTFPQSINLNALSQNGDFKMIAVGNSSSLSVDQSGAHINIASLIFYIAVFAGLFSGTGWMLDNSVDL
jgi:ABC-2 type transport system permease protein